MKVLFLFILCIIYGCGHAVEDSQVMLFLQKPASFDCEKEGVKTIRLYIYDGSVSLDTHLEDKKNYREFDCSKHSGTLSNVQKGEKTFIFEAINDTGKTLYISSSTANVIAEKSINLGSIDLTRYYEANAGEPVEFDITIDHDQNNKLFALEKQLPAGADLTPSGSDDNIQTYNWTPGCSQNGLYEISFSGSGIENNDISQDLYIMVFKTNCKPRFISSIDDNIYTEIGQNYELTFTVEDPEHKSALTLSAYNEESILSSEPVSIGGYFEQIENSVSETIEGTFRYIPPVEENSTPYKVCFEARETSGEIPSISEKCINLYNKILPEITTTYPEEGSEPVSTDVIVSADFSDEMDLQTITPATFMLKDALGNNIAGTITYENKKASFTPITQLNENSQYRAIIKSKIKNMSGIPIASDYEWTFQTSPGN